MPCQLKVETLGLGGFLDHLHLAMVCTRISNYQNEENSISLFQRRLVRIDVFEIVAMGYICNLHR